MFNNARIFLLSFLSVFFSNCKKDPPIILPNECANFSYTSANVQNWPGNDTNYYVPCFNPNNSNEIIYGKGIISGKTSYIVKRNLLTKSETNIVSNWLRKPDWSRKDWIVFNHSDNQVWKVKSNGDSLTLLTKDMLGGHNAVWSPDGNRIAFIREGNAKYYTIIADMDGNHLDTLPYFSFYLSKWSSNGLFIAALSNDYVNVNYFDVSSRKLFTPTNNFLNDHATNLVFSDAIAWTPDSQYLIWANQQGIYKTNIITNVTQKIKAACDAKYYTSLSVSPDGNKMIAARVDQRFDGKNLYIKTGLSLMNIDGTNENMIETR